MGTYSGCLLDERDIALEDARFENNFNKLDTLFEMTELQLNQMYRDADLKVFEESGTYDDLEYLYQEAEQEVSAQREGILHKIINAIGSFLRSVAEKIKSIFHINKGKGDEPVEVDAKAVEKANMIEKAVNSLQTGFAKIRSGNISGGLDILKVIAIPAVIIGGGAVGVTKMKRKDVEKVADKLDNSNKKMTNIFSSIKSFFSRNKNTEEQSDANKSLGIFRRIAKTVSDSCSNIINSLKNGSRRNGGNDDDQESLDGSNTIQNGIRKRTSNNLEYIINPDSGDILVNIGGNWVEPQGQIPKSVLRISERVKKGTYTYNTASAIDEPIDGDFVIEWADDGFIHVTGLYEVAESEIDSIFGIDLSNEELFEEEYDDFDEELENLITELSYI